MYNLLLQINVKLIIIFKKIILIAQTTASLSTRKYVVIAQSLTEKEVMNAPHGASAHTSSMLDLSFKNKEGNQTTPTPYMQLQETFLSSKCPHV